MTNRNRLAVVICTDGLGARHLGTYGNLAFPTPHLDELAVGGWLFEFCQPRTLAPFHCFGNLVGGLEDLAVPSVLVTDDTQIAEHASAQCFDQVIALPTEDTSPLAAAADLIETRLAAVFGLASQVLSAMDGPHLVWVQCRGLSGPWDAPLELREQFRGEEDPPIPEWVTPPVHPASTSEPGNQAGAWDPDELLAVYQAAAGQIQVFDQCLGTILDELTSRENTLIALTGLRGCPLGEHDVVGSSQPCLYGEAHQVPLIIRETGTSESRRIQPMVYTDLLPAVLRDWLPDASASTTTCEPLKPPESYFQPALLTSDAEGLALRTPAWCMIHATGEKPELFVKPDDRFETNDIASRCPEIVSKMLDLAERLQAHEPLKELDADLTNRWR